MLSSPLGGRADVGRRPAFEKHVECAEQGQIVLADDAREFGDARPGARTVAAHHCEQGGVHRAERERVGIGQARDPRSHPLDERNRPIDLAESPQREGQIGHRGNSWVRSESKRHFVVAPGLEQRERAFQVIPRFGKFSREPVGDALDSMRDAGLRRIGSRLDVGEKSCRLRPHRRQFAPRVAAGP